MTLKETLRSRNLWMGVACVAVIALVSAAFFYPDAFEGRTLQQHDIRQGLANGQELMDHLDQTGEKSWWTNSLFGGMPAFQISPSYPSSSLFAWITQLYGLFLPSPANLLCMMMLGMLLLLRVMKCRWPLALIGAIAWGLSSYFVIIIGAGHIWKFVTLAYVPPTIAGLVLIYRGKRLWGAALAALFMALQINSNHVQMTYYFAFVMAGFVIAYAVDAARNKTWKQWGVSTAVLAGAMLLGVAANAPNLYHTYEYSKLTMRGQHSELTSEQAPEAQATGGLDRDYITHYSYGQSETFSLLIPNINGGASTHIRGGQPMGTSLADSPEGKELMRRGQEMVLLQIFSPYFGGVEGTNGPVYVGAIIVALFLLGAIMCRGPLKWALVILTLLSIGLALGRNMQWLTDLFIDYVPMYSKFRTVESILVIAEFTMPLLAILGLKELLACTDAKRRMKALAWSFGPCAVICVVALLAPSAFGQAVGGERDQSIINMYVAYQQLPEGFRLQDYPTVYEAVESMRLGLVRADALRSLVLLAVAFLALMMWSRGKLRKAWAVAIVGIAVLVDLYGADKRYLSTESFTAPVASAPFVASPADQAILKDTDPDYRVLNVNEFQSADPSYFHKAVGGYHAAKLTRYQDLIDRHLGIVARPELPQLLALRADSIAREYDPALVKDVRAHLNVLDMLNTRYFIVDPNGEPVRNPNALGNAWFVSELQYVDTPDAEMAALDDLNPATQAVADKKFQAALGEAKAAEGTIRLTSYAPDRLEYESSSPTGGLAVFSEVYFPWGWEATVDGKPVELGRVNYILRAMQLPAGEHKVVMTFSPKSVKVTDTIATVAIVVVYLLLALAVILSIRKKKAE